MTSLSSELKNLGPWKKGENFVVFVRQYGGLLLQLWCFRVQRRTKFAHGEIAVDFVYSLKTKLRFNSHAKWNVWVSTKLTLLLRAVRTSTVVIALKKVTMIASTHKLSLSSLIQKVVHFLLSGINKLDRDLLYWKKIITVLFVPLGTTWHRFYPHQSLSVCKEGWHHE